VNHKRQSDRRLGRRVWFGGGSDFNSPDSSAEIVGGVVALLLAASGIFAVLAYAVGTRTREFGIRIALGARAAEVVGLVIREGMGFPLAGLLAGAAIAVAATRVLASSLYGISPTEPGIFFGTALLLMAVAVIACAVPAWRATRVDPMEALRTD
jgi:ABC-type antimicrobial peptide transport system permease subunit